MIVLIEHEIIGTPIELGMASGTQPETHRVTFISSNFQILVTDGSMVVCDKRTHTLLPKMYKCLSMVATLWCCIMYTIKIEDAMECMLIKEHITQCYSWYTMVLLVK